MPFLATLGSMAVSALSGGTGSSTSSPDYASIALSNQMGGFQTEQQIRNEATQLRIEATQQMNWNTALDVSRLEAVQQSQGLKNSDGLIVLGVISMMAFAGLFIVITR